MGVVGRIHLFELNTLGTGKAATVEHTKAPERCDGYPSSRYMGVPGYIAVYPLTIVGQRKKTGIEPMTSRTPGGRSFH